MLVTKKNKSFDEDHPAIIKKKPRCKKARDKFSLMHTIPMQVLSQRDEEDFGGKIKRGKRLGFTVYNALACKHCKPHVFFHKRFGLQNHSKTRHGRDGMFKMPSIPSRSISLPARVTKSVVVPRRKFSSLNKRTMIEFVDLEDDEEQIQIVDDHDLIEEIKSTSECSEPIDEKSNPEDDDLEIIDEKDVNENKIKSFKPKNYRWMESSPLYQPKVFLSSSLNSEMRKEESKDDIEWVKSPKENERLSLNDVVLVDVEEEMIVNHVRNLFNVDAQSKRKSYEVDYFSFKKSKHDEEELLLMEDEENEVLDIQSMLEVSIDETEEVIIDVENSDSFDISEILSVVESSDIIEVDLELEEFPEEEVELISLDEDDNVEFVTSCETATNVKPESIKDLVNLWATEEGALISNKGESSGKLRTKKRRRELKPYLTNRGL